MKAVGDWARRHRIALALAGMLALCSVIGSCPRASWFVWQRLLISVVFVAQGLPILLIMLFSEVVNTPGLDHVILILVGFLLGLAVEFLWKREALGKAAVVALGFMNAVAGLFIVLAGDVLVGPPYARCERMISEMNGVRIVAFPEYGMLPGGQFFFLGTRDAGKTWKQIMDVRYDDPIDPPCENVGWRVPDHYWTWMVSQLAVTNDGGGTWQDLDLVERFPDWAWYRNGLIEGATFANSIHGCVLLDEGAWGVPLSKICTQDGGETWYVPNE